MVEIEALKKEQVKLAKKVITTDVLKESEIKTIAGVDQAYFDDKVISSIVVLDYKTFEVKEKKYAVGVPKINYIPGFLSYREAHVIVEAFNKLKERPDVLMLDCNGILHPRRIGMASHVGILLDIPSIGVAKQLLLGELKEDRVYVGDEARAAAIETKEFAKPVYVSPGHKISLKTSIEVVKHCMKGHKLPEPLHEAHKSVNKIKRFKINEAKADGEDSPKPVNDEEEDSQN